MDDLGERTSYLACAVGTQVYDVTERCVGTVFHVLAAPELDVFDGIVIAAPHAREHRFADADQIGELYERGVLLTVAWDELHVPSKNPAAMEVGEDDVVKDGHEYRLEDRLRRAWDVISGRRVS
jgi:hypothetical protein